MENEEGGIVKKIKFQWKNWMSVIVVLLALAGGVIGCILVGAQYQPSVWWFFTLIPLGFFMAINIFADDVCDATGGFYTFLVFTTLCSIVLIGTWALCMWYHAAGLLFFAIILPIATGVSIPLANIIFGNEHFSSYSPGIDDGAEEILVGFAFIVAVLGGVCGGIYDSDQHDKAEKAQIVTNLPQQQAYCVEKIINDASGSEPVRKMILSRDGQEIIKDFPLKLSEVWDTTEGDSIKFVEYKGDVVGFDNLRIK